jgi:predicted kinase
MALELVVFVGLQASGKTTFFHERFAASHVHVSKDLFRNARKKEERQNRLIEEALSAGRSVVLDNTNPSRSIRATAISIAQRHGARIVAFYFESRVAQSLRRNEGRLGKARVPDVAIRSTASMLELPRWDEGFEEVSHVAIREGGFVVEPLGDDNICPSR